MRAFLVGVAGGSGAGKTTLVRALQAALGAGQALVIAHDAYYRQRAELSAEERAALNFDHPDALETPLLVEHLDALSRGQPAAVPRYDFTRHLRRPEARALAPRPVMFVDGILCLADADLRARFDLAVFVDAPESLRLARRIGRDVRERGRDRASVEAQFRASVAPMHAAHVEPSRAHADLVISGAEPVGRAAERVLRRVAQLRGARGRAALRERAGG